ncbi:unnamed protein product [Mytilus coruscus]|uniref:Uncharacterized protein n=1 Tax=Mytilus coruscus TaxID=42192 RepID=A0A6J8B3U7_MYTCO|nr:unnamed protein product [Mytilus coruscus]
MEMENQLKDEFNKYFSEAWSLNVAAVSNKLQKLEKHVQKVETQFLKGASKLEDVTKDISNLLKDTSNLNVLVDNERIDPTGVGFIGEEYEIISNDPSTSNTSQKCTSNTLRNHESRTRFMDNILSTPSETSVEDDNEYMTDGECCSSNNILERHIKMITHIV